MIGAPTTPAPTRSSLVASLLVPLLLVLAAAPAAGAEPWIVAGSRAAALVEQGALLLDVRQRVPAARRIPGARVIDWRDYSLRGRLRPAAELAARLRALGVSAARWVLVFDAPHEGWGEDGRIVWMLRLLGHRRAALVDGGYAALRRAGVARALRPSSPGDFRPRSGGRGWAIDRAGVARLVASGAARERVVLVDTRERREFDGATPYGERRGGHLPGAVHLHYRELLDGTGRLLPPARARRLLARRGITSGKRVVAYCTGGVRSAWLVAALVHLGYREVRNYPGSMWQWADGSAARYPLVNNGKGR